MGDSAKVMILVVQTKWPAMYAERDDGDVIQRLVAAEKDIDTLAREILASNVPRALPEVSGPMPDLAPFTALRSLVVEGIVTTPLPETLGHTHRSIRELSLHEWERGDPNVPASFRGGPLESLTLPPHGTLDCGLELPELKTLKVPLAVLHRWRDEIPRLVSLEELEVTPDESGMTELPEEIASLSALRRLTARHLGLRSLPALSPSLEVLSLDGNRLASLAPRFGPQPAVLYAEGNALAPAEAQWVAKEMKKPLSARKPWPRAIEPSAVAALHPQFFHPHWEGIGTIAVGDAFVFVGRRGGFGVAAFDLGGGALIWDAPLSLPDHPRAVTSVGHQDGVVLAHAKDRLYFLDERTGAIEGSVETTHLAHAFFAGGCLFGLGPDPVYWGKGRGMTYRVDARAMRIEPLAGFDNVGAVSRDGRLATTLGDAQENLAITVVEVASGKALGSIAKSHRHAFRGSDSLFVVDDANVAHEHGLDGTELRSFALGEDMEALPVTRRARPAVPYVDPMGEYLVVPRVSERKSIVDNTVAIYDASSGELLETTPPHAALRGVLDPRYYGDVYSPIEHPAIVRCGDQLLVGALVRAAEEPLVGTGLTPVRLPPPRSTRDRKDRIES